MLWVSYTTKYVYRYKYKICVYKYKRLQKKKDIIIYMKMSFIIQEIRPWPYKIVQA